MKIAVIFLSIFIFFGNSCKKDIPEFSEKDQELVSAYLMENQKIMEEMLKDKPQIRWDQFRELNQKFVVSEHSKIAEWGQKISVLIPKESTNLEESFESISKIQEILSEIRVLVPGQSAFNKFYCPMVDKYWVMKGRQIQNPYAPEMRDCGEIIP
ncbi:MAG: hypothetical protein MUF77_07555 [Leptospira sp.]|jgi:hypothetical protein|nr:hypothetical protein [Leptospira sp.]